MASRSVSRRLLAQSLRAPAAARAAARPAGRRFASTGVEHAAKKSSDLPWAIGSALVFGPAALYLLTSGGKEKGKHSADAHHDKAAKAHAPSEASLKKEEAPAPAEDAEPSKDEQPAEQSSSAVTDSEGTTVSGEEIDASNKQAFNSDVPEDAQRAEENDAKFSEGAPGQTAEAESQPDQKEKPGRSHTGTLQSEDDSGPTNLGDARDNATDKKAPKQAAKDE